MSVFYIYGNNIQQQTGLLTYNSDGGDKLYKNYFKLKKGSFGYVIRQGYCYRLENNLLHDRDEITKNHFIYFNHKSKKRINFFINLMMINYINSWFGINTIVGTYRQIKIKELKTLYRRCDLGKRLNNYYDNLKNRANI